ncbi:MULTISPECIES: hypothetical protein [Halolamina]|nr:MULTISPECIES: hypothetical protein [Halolamina]NHX37824.1 hypothetical protein [Halolamina sp. R1-12]
MRVDDVLYEAGEPVDPDRAKELAVNEVLKKPLTEHLNNQQKKYRQIAVASGVLILAGVGALAINIDPLVGGGLLIAGIVVAGGGYSYVNREDPNVTITGIEKGYWTGYSLPTDDGVMVYDAMDNIDQTEFDLEQLSDTEPVSSARADIENLSEFPVVMPPGENPEASFTGTLESVREEIENADRHTVEVPLVSTGSRQAEAVDFFASTATDEADPVSVDVEITDNEAQGDVQSLAELERMAASDHGESELEELSETSQELANDLSGLQETAIDLLNEHVGAAADAFGLVSYNFYCPDCQMDDIDSELSLSNPHEGTWYCGTCRESFETEEILPRHRIKDEIVNPVWDQLWIEKDDQRREIYENIEDQQSDLQEREFEQRSEEIRTAADRIQEIRSKIRNLKTQAKAAQGKVDEVGDLMVKYDRIHEERKREFQQEVEQSFAEIDERTERVLEETRNEEQERIEQAEQAAKEKAELIREEERRREVAKFIAEQRRADARNEAALAQQAERKRAEMGQRAEFHDEEMTMEQRQHRENWNLKTRGKTSFSSHINRFKQWKDRTLGASAHQSGGEH